MPLARYRLLLLTLLVPWCLCGIACVVYGDYVQDEGWYALIAREVARGRRLYEDVRFTQMPLFPYVYGPLLRLLPARFEYARTVSLLFCCAGTLLCARLMQERYGAAPTLLGLTILCVNRSFLYEMCQVRTHALTFALCSGAAYVAHRVERLLARPHPPARQALRLCLLLGLLAGAAVLNRLSFAPVPLVLGLVPLLRCRHGVGLRYAALASGLILPAVVSGWFLSDHFVFGVFGFHAGLGRAFPDQMQDLGAFLREAPNYTPVWLPLPFLGVALLWRRPALFEGMVLLCFGLVSAIHMTRVPCYYMYQLALGWVDVILGAWLAHALLAAHPRAVVPLGLGLLTVSLLMIPREPKAFNLKEARTPADVCRVAAPLRARPGAHLVAFDSGLAFCAPQVQLLQGYEMAEFSLFPPMPPEEQEELRGISPRRFLSDLRDGRADFVALRNELSTLPKGVQDAALKTLLERFKLVSATPGYGQFGQTMRLFQRVR